MSHDQSQNREARMNSLLQTWRVEIPLPPGFQQNVWRRIAREESPESRVKWTFWQAVSDWVQSAFSHPAMAVSYVAVLLFAGLTTGYFQAQGASARAESTWRALYVQSVDPYQAPRN